MSQLKIGQVWVCDAIGAAPPLMCVIGKLDIPEGAGGEQTIVSVKAVPHRDFMKTGWPIVSHIPFLQDAFERSGMVLVKDGAALGSDFDLGYREWRSRFDQGAAGAFLISVSAAYENSVNVAQSGVESRMLARDLNDSPGG